MPNVICKPEGIRLLGGPNGNGSPSAELTHSVYLCICPAPPPPITPLPLFLPLPFSLHLCIPLSLCLAPLTTRPLPLSTPSPPLTVHSSFFCLFASLPCRRSTQTSFFQGCGVWRADAGNVTQGQGVPDHQVLPNCMFNSPSDFRTVRPAMPRGPGFLEPQCDSGLLEFTTSNQLLRPGCASG